MSPEARQQQILEAGIEAFATRGLANATHADIAKLIGVSVPTIFHYYPNIENLQASVLQAIHRHFIKDMIEVQFNDVNVPAYERIEDILLTFQQQIDDDSHYVTIWLEWSGFTRGFMWDMYLKFYNEAVAGLRKLLMAGRKDNSISSTINVSDAARVIMGMAHTVAHMRYAGNSRRTVQNTVHSLVMSYLAP
jgi:TetR/AcrR family transcriptional regulator, hemagglutinin/protease regulatory protein